MLHVKIWQIITALHIIDTSKRSQHYRESSQFYSKGCLKENGGLHSQMKSHIQNDVTISQCSPRKCPVTSFHPAVGSHTPLCRLVNDLIQLQRNYHEFFASCFNTVILKN